MVQITKDMVIEDVLDIDESIAYVLMASGMHCIGCPSSIGESLEEAAYVHGIDPDILVAKVNEYLEFKAQGESRA